jgi:hypothetical protein
MTSLLNEKNKTVWFAGIFGCAFSILISTTSPSHAGIVNSDNAAVAVSSVLGAAAGGAVVGTFFGPPGAAAGAAAGASAVVVTSTAYTVVYQSTQHPVAAVQTALVLNPITAPIYVTRNPTEVISGAKQIWNYLFG